VSRHRTIARVRKNDDYKAAVEVFDLYELRHSVGQSTGKGQHPHILVTDGEIEARFGIACTPRSVNKAIIRKRAYNFLIEHKLIC